MIAAALALVAAGMVLVRLGWRGRRGVALAGWAAALAGMVLAVMAAGAWGGAVAMLAGTVVALGAVGLAGWRSPVRQRRAPRRAPSVTVPLHWPDLGARVAVFVLVVPVGFVAAQALALAVRGLAAGHGTGTANATVLAWLTQPLAWGVVMTVQMTRAGPVRMIAPPLVTAALAGVMWWTA